MAKPQIAQSGVEASITEFFEFEGRAHWTCGEPGCEVVADYALEWAVARATAAEAPSAEPAYTA